MAFSIAAICKLPKRARGRYKKVVEVGGMGLCGDACQLGSLKPCHGSSVCTWLSQRLCRTEGVALCLSLERQPVHSPALEK